MIPNDTITIQQASVFFLAFFTICVGLGVWLGRIFSHWRIKKLLSRIELLKLEANSGRPVYLRG